MQDGVLMAELDFESIRERYRKVQSFTTDALVSANSVEFFFKEDFPEPYVHLDDYGDYKLGDRSYCQLASRIEMPGSYFQKVDPEEQNQHFNLWLQASDKVLMFRLANGRVRAVLSEDYAVLDNFTLLDLVKPYVDEGQVQLTLFSESDGKVFMRFRFPEDLSQCGDPIFGGFNISNSEVGTCKFTADYMLYREVCANGMVDRIDGEPILNQKHLYLNSTEFRSKIVDMISQVRLRQDSLAALFEDSRGTKLTRSEQEGLFSEMKATRMLPKKLIEKLESSPFDNSWFGLINGITEEAQQFRIDRRFNIEVVAGNLLHRSAVFSKS